MEKQILHKQRQDESGANYLEYKETIGSLQYSATIFRPDISYVTGKLKRYAENSSLVHWVGVKRILWYLRGNLPMQLCLHNCGNKGPTGLVSYTNYNYAAGEDSKSTRRIFIKYRDSMVQ